MKENVGRDVRKVDGERHLSASVMNRPSSFVHE